MRLLVVTLYLLVTNLFWQPLYAEDLGKLPVFRVNAEKAASSLATGEQLGLMFKNAYPTIERLLDAHLASVMSPLEFKVIRETQLPVLRDQIQPSYIEEMRGITNKWSMSGGESVPGDSLLSLDEYHLLNLLTDLGIEPRGVSFSAFGPITESNEVLLGRNLSWPVTPEIRQLQAITVYEYKERVVVNIGFVGLVSVISGFNQDGLFVSNISAELETPYDATQASKASGSEKQLRSRGFDLRHVLDSYTTTSPTADFLSGKIYATNSNTLVADKQGVLIIEQPSMEGGEIRLSDTTLRMERVWSNPFQLATVNCFVLPLTPNRCDQKDIVRWMRLNVLANPFTEAHLMSLSDISGILLDRSNYGYEILNDQTLQSIVFIPKHKDLYIYSMPAEGDVLPPVISNVAYKDLLPLNYRLPKVLGYFDIFLWALLVTLAIALILEPVWRKLRKNSVE